MDEKRPSNSNMNKRPRNYDDGDGFDNGGVYYSPSRPQGERRMSGSATKRVAHAQPPQQHYGGQPAHGSPSNRGGARKLPASKQKSQYAVFLITTVFVGIIIFLVVFAIVFNSITSGKNDGGASVKASKSPMATEDVEPDPTERQNISNISISAIITDASKANKNISLYDIDNDKEYSVFVDNTTILKDKYGTAIVFAEFKRGDIVEASFGETDNLLSELQLSTNAWKFTSNAKVDTDAKTIKISNVTYNYNDNIITVYKNNPFDISNIDPVDTVTVRGHKDTALYIELEKSHGTIIMSGRSDIKNGMLEIDTDIFKPIDEPIEINIAEGSHRIVIKGDNIEPYSKELIVEAGGSYVLDSPDIVIKSSLVTFNISEPDATLTVNDVEMPYNEPVELDFGTYDVKITKEGFAAWEKKITLDKPAYELTAKLDSIVRLSKLTITTDPPGANIYIDNIYVGISPLSTSVEYGTRTILVKKSGFVEIDFPIDASEEFIPLPITLWPETNTVPTEPPYTDEPIQTPTPTMPPDVQDPLY